MTRSLIQLLRIRGAGFFLSLAVLACLPFALTNLLRGVDFNLLLPITLLGVFIALVLSLSNVNVISACIILLGLGPAALIIGIGGIWSSLFEAVKNSFGFVAALFKMLFFHQPMDTSALLAARGELVERILGLGIRFGLWFSGFLQGIQIEDPVIRTLIWCMALWLVAVWAGWQISRKNRLLVGVFPTTLLLAFVINYTGKEIEILWLHLGLLLFLLGLTGFSEQMSRWNLSKTDYSESTSVDTLVVVVVLTITLTAFSSFASSVSIKELIDRMREKREQTTSASQGEALGLEPVKGNANITGIAGGLPRFHLVTGGLELSQQLVMTISTDEFPPMPEIANESVPRHYWRTLTYQSYNGVGWSNPSAFGGDILPNENLVDEIPSGYQVLTQTVTFPDEAEERLYWAGTLQSADVPFEAVWLRKAESTPLLYSNMLAALASTESYQARSLVLNVDMETLRKSPSVYPEWVSRQFLSLPKTVPARVHGLARDLTASASTPYDRALAIENYLRTFPYTLEVGPPPPGRDVADYFLFDLKQGYCDYYATSMVVLARAAGLPARLVIGYANGTYDSERAQYIVTENYAHSWVEIYFSGIGWVEFEPTASEPVIQYEEKNESIASPSESLPAERSFVEKIVPFLQSIFAGAWLPAIILFVCGLLWIGYDSFRLTRLEPSQIALLIYGRFRRLARPVTGSASRNLTAHAYAFVLVQRLSSMKVIPRFQNWLAPARSEIEQLTELFSRALFAPLPPTRAEVNDAVRTWSRLRWRLLLANVLSIQKNKLIRWIQPKG
ncbi:MAG: transglutaminase domain-containing protein [Anaerolineales bacterium]|nr:transglutaminase domain-containing protein [Anaerolineales bacterium]